MFFRSRPAHVDLRVAGLVSGPSRLFIAWNGNFHLQTGFTGFFDPIQVFNVSNRLVRCFSYRQSPVKTNGPAVWNSAVAGSFQIRPGRSSGSMSEKRIIQKTITGIIFCRCFGNDCTPEFQRIQTFPRHGSMTRTTGDSQLNLHSSALSAIDSECSFLGISGTFGEDHDIGNQFRFCSRQHLLHDKHRSRSIVVFLNCGRIGSNNGSFESTLRSKLQGNFGGNRLGNDPAELVSTASAEHHVIPFRVLWKIAQLAP